MPKIINILKNHKIKLIILLVVGLIAYGATQLLGARGEREIAVRTALVTKGSFEQSVFATGTIGVKDRQYLLAKTSSIVAEVLVEPGQEVKEGQILVRLEKEDLSFRLNQTQLAYEAKRIEVARVELNLEAARSELATAQRNLERHQTLLEAGAITQVEMERLQGEYATRMANVVLIEEATLPLVKNQLEEARIGLEQAQKALERAQVVSPISGAVLTVPVKEGQMVQPGTVLATVGDLNNLVIETGINEVDATQLNIGAPVEVSAGGLLSQVYPGHIEYVAPIAELERTAQGDLNQVKIRVAIDQVDTERLKPGFTVNLKVILAAKEEALLVPYEAVSQRDNIDVVFVVTEQGRASLRAVELGLNNELSFEIISGVAVGERVIINPGPQIDEDIKVKL